LKVAGMFVSYSRLLAFAAALIGMVLVYLFLTRTYTGTAIRAIAQDRQIMPLMGVDSRRIYLITSALGGGLAGLAACLLVLQYDYTAPYPMHILIIILIWSFAYTSWSVMGRFGLVSLGHGGFMGIGAYVTALAWNYGHVSPWIGAPLGLLAGGLLAVVVA